MSRRSRKCLVQPSSAEGDGGVFFRCEICWRDQKSAPSVWRFRRVEGVGRHVGRVHGGRHEEYFLDHVVPGVVARGEDSDPILRWRLVPECKRCGSRCTWNGIAYGWSSWCSATCSYEDPDAVRDRAEKTRAACLSRFGAESYMEVPGLRERIWARSVEVRKASPEAVRDRTRETSLQRFGKECYLQTEECRNRLREASKLHKAEIQARREVTMLSRFGVRTALEIPGARERGLEVTKSRYGGFCTQARAAKRARFRKRVEEANLEAVELLPQPAHSGPVDSVLSPLEFRCRLCGDEFVKQSVTVCPSGGVDFQPRCLKCFPKTDNKNSKLQQEVLGWVKTTFPALEVEVNTKRVIPPLEVDLWFPTLNLGVEVNGLYWHSEFHGGKSRLYHLHKTAMIEERLGGHLVQVWSDEWDNHRDLVKLKLAHLLGHSKGERIHPRGLVLREVDQGSSLVREFLDRCHLQGASRGHHGVLALGAFQPTSGNQENMVGVMTLVKPRVALGQKSQTPGLVELHRFAIDPRWRVPGLLGKMLGWVSRNTSLETVSTVITYADRRWTSSKGENLYTRTGFRERKPSGPGYWYLSPETQFKVRVHRFGFRKSALGRRLGLERFDPGKTEWENMRAAGYDRVWDCGNLVYEWTRS